MKKFKAGLRLLVIVLLVMLAAFGIGFVGNFINNRERFMDNEIKTEKSERKDDEDEMEQPSRT